MAFDTPDLADLDAIIGGRFPDLAASRFSLLNAGWDSVAVDVDGVWICKFPRHAEGAARLRREVRVLEIVAFGVTLAVPRLELFETPRLFTRHRKIAGEHLLAADYARLDGAQRAALGETLGQFYAQLHGLPDAAFREAGALDLAPWLPPETILETCWPLLDAPQRRFAEATLADWAALPPDPHGRTFGYCDGHGWNMAFDHAAGRLGGVYDFADSGFAPLHQEFLYSSMVSVDLTVRIVDAYERHSGRQLDRRRISLITGAHRLWEVATAAPDPEEQAPVLAALEQWRVIGALPQG